MIEQIETCDVYQSPSDKLSYSWVFGQNTIEGGKTDLEDILPDPGTEVEFRLGELRSFKQKDPAGESQVNGILKEVLTCNVIDQKTCDWRSVKKELKSLEKLKPVAIIDPLTLPAKLNGFETKNIDSPWYSSQNTEVTNGYYDSKTNESYDELDSKCKYDSDIDRVDYLNEYNGYLNNTCEPTKDLSSFKTTNGYKNGDKNHIRSPDVSTPIRPLSPILEISQENDNYSSTVSSSSSTDRSSCTSADFYIGTYSTERGESGMNSFCISPEELYSYRRINGVAAAAHEKAIQQSISTLNMRHSTAISIPVSLPSSKICTSECQVINRVISALN